MATSGSISDAMPHMEIALVELNHVVTKVLQVTDPITATRITEYTYKILSIFSDAVVQAESLGPQPTSVALSSPGYEITELTAQMSQQQLNNQGEYCGETNYNPPSSPSEYGQPGQTLSAPWPLSETRTHALASPSRSLNTTLGSKGSSTTNLWNGSRPSSRTLTVRPPTWAAVAAGEGKKNSDQEPNPSTSFLKFAPSRIAKADYPAEGQHHQSRVVWITPSPVKPYDYTAITAEIQEGPLAAIIFLVERKEVCIIFKDAADARAFVTKERKRIFSGESSYGRDTQLIIGDPYPTNDNIRAMDGPMGARRRLVIVRRGLFYDLTRNQFEQDLRRWAGAENIELIHLYNSGNATVVLSSVERAHIVKSAIETMAKKENAYNGVRVTYARDPTEEPMRLVSVIQGERGTCFRP